MAGAILGALYGARAAEALSIGGNGNLQHGWLPVDLVSGLENGERGKSYALELAAKLAELDLKSFIDMPCEEGEVCQERVLQVD